MGPVSPRWLHPEQGQGPQNHRRLDPTVIRPCLMRSAYASHRQSSDVLGRRCRPRAPTIRIMHDKLTSVEQPSLVPFLTIQ